MCSQIGFNRGFSVTLHLSGLWKLVETLLEAAQYAEGKHDTHGTPLQDKDLVEIPGTTIARNQGFATLP